MPPIALADKFWAKVVVKDGCWGWIAATSPAGYAKIMLRVDGRKIYLGGHRVSWELHHGAIPVGLSVLHRCDNRICTNPGHLFLGSAADNVADMVAKGRNVNPSLALNDQRIGELLRSGRKGDAVEDLRKGAWYLQREIARLEGQP